jgi:polyisoprenoid-binding protein YceI
MVINPDRTHIISPSTRLAIRARSMSPDKFEGWIEVDLEDLDKSSVAFHAASRSVDVGSRSFDDFMRSRGSLNAACYPSIDFVSKDVEKIDDHTVRVSGNLTLLGATMQLAVDVAVQKETGGANQRLEFKAQTRIDRLEYGMNGGFRRSRAMSNSSFLARLPSFERGP